MLQSEQNGITVREIRESDLAQYRDLRLEGVRQNVNNHFATIFVAEQNSLLIGMTGVRRDYGVKGQHNATIWGVYVRSNARSNGLAGTLLAHAMLWAQQMGITRLELKVSTQNSSALALYTKAGFEIAGTLRGTLRIADRIVDEYIFERSL